MWHIYLIEKRGILYTGITTDLKNRMRQHGRPRLLYTEAKPDRAGAVAREREIKGWTRAKKLALADSGKVSFP